MSKTAPASPTRLLKEAERLARREATIKRARLELAKKLIQAGHLLGGSELDSEAPAKIKRSVRRRRTRVQQPTKVVPQRLAKADRVLRKKTWPATMLRILKQADRLVPYAELKEELAKTHLAPKLARSDKSFYGSLLKLETMGLAVRNGGRAATTEVFQRFKADVEAGRIKDEPIRNTGGDRNSPAKKAILDLLLATGGASPSAIVKELIPKLDLNTKNSKTAVYNLIARLVKRDELIRDGTIIRLPSKSKNGTEPDAEALNKTNVGREFGATTH